MAVPGITWREREFPTGTRRKKMETTARQKAPTNSRFVRHFARTSNLGAGLGACEEKGKA